MQLEPLFSLGHALLWLLTWDGAICGPRPAWWHSLLWPRLLHSLLRPGLR